MAPGPAALALAERRPLHPVSIRHERRGRGWGIVITFHPAVDVPEAGTTRERATAMTQACADVLGAAIRASTPPTGTCSSASSSTTSTGAGCPQPEVVR